MSKPTLVLLSGMMCDHRLFAPQVAELTASWDVLLPPLTGSNSMAGLAQQILSETKGSFALLGLSMGGILAMEFVRQAPERITHLALLDTNPKAEPEQIKALRRPQIEAAQSGRLFDVMREEMKPRYLFDGPNKAAILDTCMDMALELGPGVFVDQSHALMNRVDSQESLKQVSVPTLILCGRHDELCPVERHELLHDLIPQSKLVIIEEAGHLPVLEQPFETNQALKNWLNA